MLLPSGYSGSPAKKLQLSGITAGIVDAFSAVST